MISNYLIKVLFSIENANNSTIMICRYKLKSTDYKCIKDVATKYKKTIIYASIREILFNNREDILIVR